MRPEVEAHALLAAKHFFGMLTGRPSAFPRPLQQFSACSRQEAAPIDKRKRGNIAKQCAYLRTWLLEMMKTPQLTVWDGEVSAK